MESPIEGTSTLTGAPLAASALGAAAPPFPPFFPPTPGANAITACPTFTVSPTFASTRVTVPPLGARTSIVTLSVSICATVSSVATSSPTAFVTLATAPSEIESPIDGTAIVSSRVAVPPLCLRIIVIASNPPSPIIAFARALVVAFAVSVFFAPSLVVPVVARPIVRVAPCERW